MVVNIDMDVGTAADVGKALKDSKAKVNPPFLEDRQMQLPSYSFVFPWGGVLVVGVPFNPVGPPLDPPDLPPPR